MSKSDFIALVNSVGGPEFVLTVICDNSYLIRYLDNDHILDIDNDIVTIGDTDYIKSYTVIKDKRIEKRSTDHIITTYHPMECIQGIQVLNSTEERSLLDRSEMFDF